VPPLVRRLLERDEAAGPDPQPPQVPLCEKTDTQRIDARTPVVTVSDWEQPVRLGAPINTPCPQDAIEIAPDGDTMYYASGRNPLIGMAIYRSARSGGVWGGPQLVIRGLVGEPSLTADGRLLYFVHVLSDADGTYDSDVWYCRRAAP
jgi:hypothetical protein